MFYILGSRHIATKQKLGDWEASRIVMIKLLSNRKKKARGMTENEKRSAKSLHQRQIVKAEEVIKLLTKGTA